MTHTHKNRHSFWRHSAGCPHAVTRQPISICDIVTVTAMIILFMLAHVPLIIKCNVATVKGADSLTSLSINEFKSCATLWTDVQYSVLPCTDSCRLCALIIQPWTDEPHCALMFHVLWWFSRELMSRIVLWCSICTDAPLWNCAALCTDSVVCNPTCVVSLVVAVWLDLFD